MLPLIVNAADPQQAGLLVSFDSQGQGIEQDFIKGDRKLALAHRPVIPSGLNAPPWADDWLDTDTFQISIGIPGAHATSGTFLLGIQRSATKTITNVTVAFPAEITTSASHDYSDGDVVFVSGTTGVTPNINNQFFVVTVSSPTTFTIPINVTVGGATGGTLISFNTSGLAALAYNAAPSSFLAQFNAVSSAEGYGDATITLLETGNYEFAWDDPGAVPLMYGNGSNLLPVSSAVVLQVAAGDSLTPAIQTVELSQQPVAFCTPSTPFPVAAINASITQAGAVGPPAVDKVYAIVMTTGTYGGTFYVTLTNKDAASTSFIAEGTISASAFQTLLSGATGLTTADIAVTRVGDTLNVQFQGTQAGTNVPTITVANIDLIAPLGVTGQMDLNTINLYVAFAQTTANSIAYTFAIRRDRATGESAEYFQHAVTLKRNLIQGPLVPLLMPTYYTAAQVDALISSIKDGSGNILVGTKFRIAPTTNGAILQASTDGSTWQNALGIVAS